MTKSQTHQSLCDPHRASANQNKAKPEATHLSTQHSGVSVSRTECPSVTESVRLVSKFTQKVRTISSYPIARRVVMELWLDVSSQVQSRNSSFLIYHAIVSNPWIFPFQAWLSHIVRIMYKSPPLT